MTNAEINEIFGITESYQLPELRQSALKKFSKENAEKTDLESNDKE